MAKLYKVNIGSFNPFILKAPPYGTYELMQNVLDEGPLGGHGALAKASIDGIRLKIGWDFIETSPGSFTWTNLDDAITKVKSYGKKCGIGIGTGLGAPPWLYDSTLTTPAQYYTMVATENAGQKIHQPGDPIFLARLTSFINTVAAHTTAGGFTIDSDPAISYLTIEGNSRHAEWNIANTPEDTANLGNTQAKVDIWIKDTKDIIDIYMDAFPTTTLISTLQKPFANTMGWPAMYTASNYGIATYGKHYGLMFSGLNAHSSTNVESANQINDNWITNPTWSQFGSAHGGTDGDPVEDGVDQGLRSAVNLKIRGCEIYKADCDDDTIFNYTAPYTGTGSATWQGVDVTGTPAGITPRRAEMLAMPLPTG